MISANSNLVSNYKSKSEYLFQSMRVSTRKVAIFCTAIFVALANLGFLMGIPGLKDIFLPLTIASFCFAILNMRFWKIHKSQKVIYADPVAQSLSTFNNDSMKGQINGIYITTNETNIDATQKLLKDCPRLENGIHIGCAAWHNFDIICLRKSQYGLIVDFNPKNAQFIKKTAEIIKVSETRIAFRDAMIAYLNSLQGQERKVFFHSDQKGLPTDKIDQELSREGGWLCNEENYLFIKKLISSDRLVAITESVTNHEIFSQIRLCLEDNDIKIDTVYFSNICNFMRNDHDRQAFARSIKYMMHHDTIFISCPKLLQNNDSRTIILQQVPLMGRDILKNNFRPEQLFETQ